ncbi:hypothetical protein B0H11DRAFT_1955339 [Mycena galericulata]|nr:hypothetical protein B0H11DRAFT_1955339 [Mycena galericulata]
MSLLIVLILFNPQSQSCRGRAEGDDLILPSFLGLPSLKILALPMLTKWVLIKARWRAVRTRNASRSSVSCRCREYSFDSSPGHYCNRFIIFSSGMYYSCR